MQHDKLVREIKKAGYEVIRTPYSKNHYFVTSDDRMVSWWEEEGEACGVTSRKRGEKTEGLVTYTNGTVCETVEQTVNSLSK